MLDQISPASRPRVISRAPVTNTGVTKPNPHTAAITDPSTPRHEFTEQEGDETGQRGKRDEPPRDDAGSSQSGIAAFPFPFTAPLT